MKRPVRSVLLIAVAVALVNLPLLHSGWTERRVDRSGVDVAATVVDHGVVNGQHLLTFRFPASVAPGEATGQADVTVTAYDAAVESGEIEVRVVPGDPSAYQAVGQVESRALLVMTVLADVVLLVVALLLWRFRGRHRQRLEAIAVTDVERCAPGAAFDQIEGGTYLIRGEVSGVDPGRVVIDLGDRSVLVHLDGHANPVGYQQPAQVQARLL